MSTELSANANNHHPAQSHTGVSSAVESASSSSSESSLQTSGTAAQRTVKNLQQSLKQSNCANCGHPLDGPFCGKCGQPEKSMLRFFGSVVLHILDDIFGWDSRAGRTLMPLMFRPGFLTNEYFRGRRVHYVPPIRLYIFVSIIFFLVLGLFTDDSVKDLVKIQQDHSQQIKQISGEISALQSKMSQPDYVRNKDDTKQLKNLLGKRTKAISDLESGIAEMQSDVDSIKQRQSQPDYIPDPSDDIQLVTFEKTIQMMQKNLDQQTKVSSEVESSNQTNEQKAVNLEATTGEILNEPKGKASSSMLLSFDKGFDFLSKAQNEWLINFAKNLEQKAKAAFEQDAGPLIKQILSVLPQTMFVLLPIFALLLKFFYLFSNRLYMEHLVVALHSHAFIFVNLLMLALLSVLHDAVATSYAEIGEWLEYVIIGFTLWIPVYLFMMQKRVYKQGKFMTTVKFALVGMSYMVLLFFSISISFIWGLASL